MFKHAVHIVSPQSGSIWEITQGLIECFKLHFDITVEGLEEPTSYDILFCHFVHPNVTKSPSFNLFKHKVLVQPIDGTSIKQEYVELLNKFDLIITPAQAGKNIMQANGVTTPIKVIPNYYKKEILEFNSTRVLKDLPNDRFIFYHESTLHPRKGIELLFEGYIKAFSDSEYADKVLLVVKDMPLNQLTFDRVEKLKRNMIQLQKQYKKPATIYKISQYLPLHLIKELWNRADAYVSLAKIEGYGLPLARFAVFQKPIVALENKNSGYMDFLNKKNSYLIPIIQQKAIGEHMNLYTEETEWAIPDIVDVSKNLIKCYEDCIQNKSRLVDNTKLEKMEYNVVMKKYIHLLKKIKTQYI